jgi:hypothetical protein
VKFGLVVVVVIVLGEDIVASGYISYARYLYECRSSTV